MNPVICKLLDNINSLAREIEGKSERGNHANQEVQLQAKRTTNLVHLPQALPNIS